MLTTERFITQVVASQIKGDYLKERGESATIWLRQVYQKSRKPWIMTINGPLPILA